MLSLTVSRNSGQPLADQIVAGIKRQIDVGTYGRASSCRRSVTLPKATMSAVLRSSRLTIAWSRWAVCSRAAAPASIRHPRSHLRRRRTPPRPITLGATRNWSG